MCTEPAANRRRSNDFRGGRPTRRCFHSSPFTLHSSIGFTLVEMIVILVVVSIAAVALVGAITTSVARSADPMLRMQAVAVAQMYLEEATLLAFQDPDGGEGGGCEAGETRGTYDDVQDYNCISGENPTDQFSTSPGLLSDYTVDMTVTPVLLDPNAMQALRVDVTVTHPRLSMTLTGYRGNY